MTITYEGLNPFEFRAGLKHRDSTGAVPNTS